MELKETLVIIGLLLLILLPTVIVVWKTRQSEKPAETDLEPKISKAEVIYEIMEIFRSEITRRMIRNGHRLGSPSLEVNPLKPTDHTVLTRHLLGGNISGVSYNVEVLERILRKLLQDDYDKYWSIAEKQAITKRRR